MMRYSSRVRRRWLLQRVFHTLSPNFFLSVTLATFVFVSSLFTVHSFVVHSPLVEREISQLEKYNIIPDYISMPPECRVDVNYASGVSAQFGNLIAERKLTEAPSLFWEARKTEYFTLIMINPDRMSKEPVPVDYLQWLVVNIKGNNISTGQAIFQYEPPKAIEPFPRFHTYVFLVYFQEEGVLHVDRSYAASGKKKEQIRVTFNVKRFTIQHHLHEPSAVNFYRVKNPKNKNDFSFGF